MWVVSLSKAYAETIEIFEMSCIRHLGKISWKARITNEEVLKRMKTKRELLKNIAKRKMKYYGHIKRRNNLLTTLVEGKIQGKRPRGRPRNSWFGDIKQWSGRNGFEATQSAGDRHLWSIISHRPLLRRWYPQVIQVITAQKVSYIYSRHQLDKLYSTLHSILGCFRQTTLFKWKSDLR